MPKWVTKKDLPLWFAGTLLVILHGRGIREYHLWQPRLSKWSHHPFTCSGQKPGVPILPHFFSHCPHPLASHVYFTCKTCCGSVFLHLLCYHSSHVPIISWRYCNSLLFLGDIPASFQSIASFSPFPTKLLLQSFQNRNQSVPLPWLNCFEWLLIRMNSYLITVPTRLQYLSPSDA